MAMLYGVRANAQTPYDKEKMEEIGNLAKNGKASMSEFVSWAIAEPEDEVYGPLNKAWDRYRRRKPLDKGVKIVLDEKNGYFRYDVDYEKQGADPSKSTLFVEICLWNCDDGEHKLMAVNIGGTANGKPHDNEQYDGYAFYLYDKVTRELYIFNEVIDADELSSLISSPEWQYDGKQWYYVTDYVTGEKTQMNSEEFGQWLDSRLVVEMSLPRDGKDIKVIVYSATGNKEYTFTWDGYRFHLAK